MLPGLDGWGVLDAIRAKGVRSAVLMLTARESVEDRVRGLEGGADDYLCKPFAFSELLARIRTLLRRLTQEPPSSMEFEGVRLDPKRQRVTRDGAPIELTTKEFQLLDLLLQHRGEVLSKVMISEHLWDMNFDSDSNVVEVHVGRLRAKIDAPFERKILHTVRGRGYVIR
jgi:two-component system copper resistance phosphate regulon response regulator CusR